MIVNIIQDLRKEWRAKIEKMQEMFTKDLEELRNRDEQYTRRNQQQGNGGRRMYKWPGRQKVAINAAKQNIEKRMKRNEGSLTDLWDNIKHTNIHIIGVPGEEREKGP